MAQPTESSISRTDARTPLAEIEAYGRAATQRHARTDFLIEAALQKSEQGIAMPRCIHLSMSNQKLLIEVLQNRGSLQATQFIKDLANEYVGRAIRA